MAATSGGFTLHTGHGWHYRTPVWGVACEGLFERLKVEFFHGGGWRGWTAEIFIAELSAYIRWYLEGHLKAFREGGRCTIRSGAAGLGPGRPPRPVQEIVRIPRSSANPLGTMQ